MSLTYKGQLKATGQFKTGDLPPAYTEIGNPSTYGYPSGFASSAETVITPNGLWAFSASREGSGADLSRLNRYAIDKDAGTVTIEFGYTMTYGGANFTTVSPEGTHLYVGHYATGLSVWSLNETTGAVSEIQTIPGEARYLEITPNGQYLFVGGRDGLKLYSRNTSTGQLTFEQRYYVSYGTDNDQLSAHISPDGTKLFMTNNEKNLIITHTLNQTTGAITVVDQITSTLSLGGLLFVNDATSQIKTLSGELFDFNQSTLALSTSVQSDTIGTDFLNADWGGTLTKSNDETIVSTRVSIYRKN